MALLRRRASRDDLCPEFFFCAGFAGGVDFAAGAFVRGAFAGGAFAAGGACLGLAHRLLRFARRLLRAHDRAEESLHQTFSDTAARYLRRHRLVLFLGTHRRPALSPNNAFALSLAHDPTRKLIHPDQAGAGFSRSRVGRIGRKPFHFTSSARDGRTARQSPRSKLRCRQVQPGVPGRPSGGRNLLRSGRRPARAPLPVTL